MRSNRLLDKTFELRPIDKERLKSFGFLCEGVNDLRGELNKKDIDLKKVMELLAEIRENFDIYNKCSKTKLIFFDVFPYSLSEKVAKFRPHVK